MDWSCRSTARWSLVCDCCSSCRYTIESLKQQTIRSNAEPISSKKSHHWKLSGGNDDNDDDNMPSFSTIGGKVVVVGTTLCSIHGDFSEWTIKWTLWRPWLHKTVNQCPPSNQEVKEITNGHCHFGGKCNFNISMT